MKNLVLLLCCLVGMYAQQSRAQIPFKQDSYLDLRVHYIADNDRENYKWLHPDNGKNAFLYLSDIQVEKCTCPADNYKGLGIFKSFTLVGRWFNLLGEFAANPGIMYEYNDDFTFIEKGVKYNINKALLAKYPALLKRLKYAAPLHLDYTLRLDSQGTKGHVSGLDLMVKDIDLLIPAENEMPYMVAGAPAKWNDRLSLTHYPNLDETEMKKAWASITEVSDAVFLYINNLTLPIDEFIAISDLYKQYEKEGKELKDDYKMLEPDYKPAIASKPYTKVDQWKEPYEPEVRTAKIFKMDGNIGLRSGSKIVFETADHSHGDSLPGTSKYFSFYKKSNWTSEIFNAKGKKMSIGGFEEFRHIEKSAQGDGYTIITANKKNSSYVYSTQMSYGESDIYYTSESLDALKQKVIDDKKAAEEEEEEEEEDEDDGGRKTITIGFGPPPVFYFYEVTILHTDENLRVLNTEPGYITYTQKQ